MLEKQCFLCEGQLWSIRPNLKYWKESQEKGYCSLKDFNIQEKDFKLKDLMAADEVFITSTTKGVLPIVKIDSKIISNGKIGVVTSGIKKEIELS